MFLLMTDTCIPALPTETADLTGIYIIRETNRRAALPLRKDNLTFTDYPRFEPRSAGAIEVCPTTFAIGRHVVKKH